MSISRPINRHIKSLWTIDVRTIRYYRNFFKVVVHPIVQERHARPLHLNQPLYFVSICADCNYLKSLQSTTGKDQNIKNQISIQIKNLCDQFKFAASFSTTVLTSTTTAIDFYYRLCKTLTLNLVKVWDTKPIWNETQAKSYETCLKSCCNNDCSQLHTVQLALFNLLSTFF